MKPAMKFDPRAMRRALHEYSRATKKDEAEILNRAGRNVVIRAYRGTDEAQRGRIRSYLSAENNRMAGIILAKRGALKGLTRAQVRAKVRKFIAASVRSVRYVKVGFMKAGQAFGAFTNARVNPRSEAAKGFGAKATAARLRAVIGNNSRGADAVALRPLQRACLVVAADMLGYAKRKMAQTGRKYSGK